MAARLLNYTIAFAVLAVGALLYHVTVVRWLKPPDVVLAEIVHVRQAAEPSPLDQMFPEGSWQRSAGKRLIIKDQGYVLFSERKQITPSQWRVWPVTVVMQRHGQPSIVMDAPEGAEVTFAEALDVVGSEAPPIKGGQLIGKVSIRSTAARAGESLPMRDQLEIQASDVGIDSRRIWTNEAIHLRWGQSVLDGRNLTIRLAGGGAIPTSGGQSPLSVLDSMELVYLERLQLPVPGRGRIHGGAGPAGTKAAGATPPDVSGDTADVSGDTADVSGDTADVSGDTADVSGDTAEVPDGTAEVPDGTATLTCKGRVTFDFATDLLQLRDSVRLVHQPHEGPEDTIRCDRVTLEFNNPLASDLARESVDDWLQEIEAVGRPVLIKLPSVEAEAVAESIRYDAEAGTLHVQGSAGVRLAYRGVNFQTSDFVYQFHADDPERIGALDCAGSGFLDFQNDPSLAIKTLRWSKGLRLQPLADADRYEVWIDGKVTTTLTDGGKILADTLRGSFRRLAPDPKKPAQHVQEPRSLATLEPEQASATGNVVFDTSLMYAETNLLQLFFDVLKPGDQPAGEPGVALNPASGAAKRFWVRQPEQADTVTPVARPRPTLTAESVHANLTLAGREVVGSDLSVVGRVRLKHRMATERAVLPLTAAGEKLRVVSKGGHDMMQITGGPEPARFDLGDGFFVGPLIRVSTSDNYVWINRQGHLQIPTALLPGGGVDGGAPSGASVAPNPLATGRGARAEATMHWAAPPSCRWGGEMFFDGRTVELAGGVQLDADLRMGQEQTPWKLVATGGQMQIALDRPVQIRQSDAVREAALDAITLRGTPEQPVFVTADQSNAQGTVQARHVFSAPQLVVQPQSGQLHGPGPGWYRQWAVAQQDSAFSGLVPEGHLIGTHLTFADRLHGDLARKELRFEQSVRIGVRPVRSWEETFDALAMDALDVGQATVDCQTLRLAQAPQSPAPVTATAPAGFSAFPGGQDRDAHGGGALLDAWEIEALGSVAFRVRNERGLFETTGNRASYATAKDLFIIEGDGRQPARLKQTHPSGLPGANIAMGIIKIRPQAMEVDGQLQSASPGMLPASMRKRQPLARPGRP
ncbi:hypothetical protein [Roseimaritima sediminicola]|uniref:hypothetical protein n=1 Tax=Roseimaritima sediminicola TaxID=2662066 RepID=UPI0012982ED8|nr:hypothetical protein [Roseimaritima sediminicola]